MQGETSVSVDRDFARFGKKSYAINKINSVEVRERQPHGQGSAFVYGLLAFICLLAGVGGDLEAGGRIMWLLLCGMFGYLTYRAWGRSKIVEYQLFLMTSSSEAQALVSRDGDMIEGLRDRIERAMAGQLA